MKTNNTLVVITGESAQGKTPIAKELKREYGFYVIHTDLFSYKTQDHRLGEDYKEKRDWIKSHIENLTPTFVVEGVHACHQSELDLYTKYLGVTKSHAFKIENPNHKAQFEFKHRKALEEDRRKYMDWFDNLMDIEATVVRSYMELEDILIIRNFI